MSFSKLVTGLALSLVLAIPAMSAWATHRSEAEQAITEAKSAHAQAEAAGVAAPETAQMIADAEALIPSRQYTKAREMALLAMKQDQFALEQTKQAAPAAADASKAAAAAIAAAETARKKAASVGGEWRDTAKLIKEAEDLAKAGDYAAASALADQARRQGEMGYEQAIREKDATFPSYMTKK
jgi:hypothetical protein